MLILFDEGTPSPLATFLEGHTVKKAKDLGWDALIKAAEDSGFQILLTTDKNIRYQQNLTERTIAIVVLGHARWPIVRLYVERVAAAVNAATPGSYTEVEIPIR
jgi:hypothetical protein